METARAIKRKSLVVCHDAGAAEVVASWVKRHPEEDFLFFLEGPSVEVFRRRLGRIERISGWNALSSLRSELDRVITGTSWSTDLERRMLGWAKTSGLPTVTFLDHWVNYRVRFETEQGMILPDQIIVYDEFAREKVFRDLGSLPVQIIDNPYWEDIVSSIRQFESKVPRSTKRRILFAAQPISDAALKVTGRSDGYGYTEMEALAKLMEWLRPSFSQIEEFRIRLHPSESSGKYDAFARQFKGELLIRMSHSDDLAEDIAWADEVIGCDTMAMVIGLKAGRKVYSCIPEGGRSLEIPLTGIERIFQK